MLCKNCNSELPADAKFCSHCGYPIRLKRIDKTYFLDEISQIFNFEKGFLFTIKTLFTNPTLNIKTFITEITMLTGIVQSIVKADWIGYGMLVGFIYSIVFTAQFFDKGKPLSYIKALLARITAFLIVTILIAIGVVLYYLLFKNR